MHFLLAVKFTSPKLYVFYGPEQKPDKGNKLWLYNANKSANNYENVIVVDEILRGRLAWSRSKHLQQVFQSHTKI